MSAPGRDPGPEGPGAGSRAAIRERAGPAHQMGAAKAPPTKSPAAGPGLILSVAAESGLRPGAGGELVTALHRRLGGTPAGQTRSPAGPSLTGQGLWARLTELARSAR